MSEMKSLGPTADTNAALKQIALKAEHPKAASNVLPVHADRYFSLLQRKIDHDVLCLLPDRVLLDMTDALSLRENVEYGTKFGVQLFDYSVIIAPLYKALEGTLFYIANELGLKVDEPWKVGRALQADKIGEYFDEVISKMEKLSADQKLELNVSLTNCRTLLVYYRHNPAHYLNEVIPTYEKLVQKTDFMFETISELVKRLNMSGLLKGE